ncbi:MAG: SPOR domain-containing protein [Rikenellaceae bacterium]
MIRKITVGVASLLAITSLCAQSLDNYTSKLATPTSTDGGREASVAVSADNDAREAIKRIEALPRNAEFLGYRVGIYFDNSPSARVNAQEVLTKFRNIFPNVESFMIYENPYFKVSAGSCATQEEAVMLLNRVQRHFPDAYLMREQMTARDITKTTIPSVYIPEPQVGSL